MKNKDLFVLNPDGKNLINDGFVQINKDRDVSVIRHELQTFVCEGEYQRGLQVMLQTYLNNLSSSKQPAAWVSGFFGSGKSHLVKMMGLLWEDYRFANGDTARLLKPLPTDITDLLTELDRKQKLYGRLSVSGTLKDFPAPDIRASFLQLFLNALNLPTQYHLFKFVYWTKQEGIHDELKAAIEAQGRDFVKEYQNLFVSPVLARSILTIKPALADTEKQLKDYFALNFAPVSGISRDQLITTIRDEALPLVYGTKLPCTIIILDEVQQFIGTDGNKTIDIQNLAQDLCSSFDGRFLLVGTGQNSLSETPLLQPLQDRFTVKVSLSDTDVETVTRKTVLEKKPTVVAALAKKLDDSLGEISRNLAGTDFGYRTDDRATLVADYPIMPSTRKFWKKVLQAIDTAGVAGQLRSQLRIVDESLKTVADHEWGQVVPADFIFDQKLSQMVQNGSLLNETNNLIAERKAKSGNHALEGRILSAVFLIDRLPQEGAGGRLISDENTIADLLLSDLNQPADSFRQTIKSLIAQLVTQKLLMPIGNEFKLQTKIGAEWEQEFSIQAAKLTNAGDDRIQEVRKDRLLAFLKDRSKALNIQHGQSKMKREVDIHTGTDRPTTDNRLNLWLRDGWNENEAIVLNELRAEGADTPLAYAFVGKQRDADLRSAIIGFLAADLTLKTKGMPTTPEGLQARKSMETRRMKSEQTIIELIDTIGRDTAVYLAGGTRVDTGDLRTTIEEAVNNLADRQFPEFKTKGDYKDWDKALAKALTGDPDALKRIGWDKDATQHPVAGAILSYVGTGIRTGRDVRQQFMKAPYGWSQDAVDAMLVVLTRSEHLSTTETALNQAKIGPAPFKKESHTLTAPEKIKLRKLYLDAGVSGKPGDEFAGSNALITTLKTLADRVGGDSPRPEPVSTSFLQDIENLDGNERLQAILTDASVIRQKYTEWKQQADQVQQREPAWQLLSQLMPFAPPTPDAGALRNEQTAIRTDRLLLAEPDPVQPLLNRLADLLKTAVQASKSQFDARYDELMARLQADEYFRQVPPDEKNAILKRHQLLAKPELKATDAAGLLAHLQKLSLETWQTKMAALPSQFEAARSEAIDIAAPKAQSFSLPKRTLNTAAELDAYLTDLRTQLEELLQTGSAIILK